MDIFADETLLRNRTRTNVIDNNNNNEMIKKMLLTFNMSSYIIIRPKGHNYKQVSEYNRNHIPKILEAEW